MSAPEKSSAGARRLDLRSDLTELDRLGTFVRAIGHDEGLDADQIFALELCLEEAVVNIIMHGGLQDQGGTHISVTLLSGAPALTLCLEDDGRPFDPTAVPPPALGTSLEDVPIGGMGIHLIRKLTAGMRYEHSGGRNRLILAFGTRIEAQAESVKPIFPG